LQVNFQNATGKSRTFVFPQSPRRVSLPYGGSRPAAFAQPAGGVPKKNQTIGKNG
jgi:hypothetical protein